MGEAIGEGGGGNGDSGWVVISFVLFLIGSVGFRLMPLHPFLGKIGPIGDTRFGDGFLPL